MRQQSPIRWRMYHVHRVLGRQSQTGIRRCGDAIVKVRVLTFRTRLLQFCRQFGQADSNTTRRLNGMTHGVINIRSFPGALLTSGTRQVPEIEHHQVEFSFRPDRF
jgi:hypothetical protein